MPFTKGHKINVGRKFSMAHNQKISLANKGKKFSKEHRKKLSIAHTGVKLSFYHRKRQNEGRKRGSEHWNWKNGQRMDNGYICILQPNHPHANKSGYVLRSHLVMEREVKRYLTMEEVVHHINGIKSDDRPENLQLFKNKSKHAKSHYPIGSKFGVNQIKPSS